MVENHAVGAKDIEQFFGNKWEKTIEKPVRL